MLYDVLFDRLVDDFGWFGSQSEAEAKIAQLQRITRPARFLVMGLEPGAMN